MKIFKYITYLILLTTVIFSFNIIKGQEKYSSKAFFPDPDDLIIESFNINSYIKNLYKDYEIINIQKDEKSSIINNAKDFSQEKLNDI